MYKLAISSALILACGILGLAKGHTYTQRFRELQEIKDILLMLRTEIHYRKDPLPVIFRRISESKDTLASRVLLCCRENIETGKSLQESWQSAVSEMTAKSCLTETDKKILYDMGIQLGRSNVKGQSDLLILTQQKIELQLAEADTDRHSKGKMYSGLGFSLGIVITVLLI